MAQQRLTVDSECTQHPVEAKDAFEKEHPGAIVDPALRRLAFAVAVSESGVAEARADRQHTPAFHVLHERDLGEALHDSVVVHDDGRVVVADPRDGFD
jgi:hypothetical protein